MLASTESLSEEVHMQTNYESEFVRTPILENRVFFLSSRCTYCGYLILASSASELIDEEEQHAVECNATQGSTQLRPAKA
jgi:hypothetical protein